MSTFWHSTRPADFTASRAGGEASLSDVFTAAMRQMAYVDNFLARQAALDEAIDRRNDEVFSVTGVRPRHPYRTSDVATRAEKLARWQREVEEAARRIPDGTVGDRLSRSIEADALAIARESEEHLGRLSASRPGLGTFLAEFGGAMVGALRDPLVFPSLAFGFGPGASRSVAGRILTGAAREAAVNAGLSAAAQPEVQDWRAAAGLPHGELEAIRNVTFAAVLGGAFGAAGQGAAEGLGKLRERVLQRSANELAERAAAEFNADPELVRRALSGDIAAARQLVPEIREALPAPVRGAIDQAEQLDHLDAVRPASAAPEHHDVTVSAAHRAIERAADPDHVFPGFSPDPAQVTRIADEIAGPPPAAPGFTPKSLVEFLTDRGGVLDEGGVLAQLGAADLARDRSRRAGSGRRAVPDRRVSLDYAREAAEEAGYIGRAGEMQVATTDELLAAIDAELRGKPVYARADEGDVAAVRDWEADRAGVESAVHDVARLAGPAVEDRLIRAAAELALAEKMDAGDALERVLVRAELSGEGAAAPARSGEELPGWSDEDLLEASSRRGNPPDERTDGLDRPADAPDSELAGDRDIAEFGDVLVPDEDGNVVPLSRYLADAARDEDFAALIEACRV